MFYKLIGSLITKKKLLLGVLALLCASSSFGQAMNLPFYDYGRKIHFGFTLGLNTASFKYELSPEFYATDSIMSVGIVKYPGIQLGGIANLHMGEHFDLRFIPTLVLAQRGVEYTLADGTTRKLDVETVMVEAPLTLKLKSIRHRNVRFYVIGGVKFGFDMASDEGGIRSPQDPKIVLSAQNYYYEYGCGFDLYFPYFKFSPEIKFSNGLNNVFVPDESLYNKSFNKFFSQFFLFSLHFE